MTNWNPCFKIVLITRTGICSGLPLRITDVYTDTVTEFIRKCIGDVVPTVTIKTYPNQIDGTVEVDVQLKLEVYIHLGWSH